MNGRVRDEINALLRQARTRQEAIDALDYIRTQLLAGTFP
jgi:hypothetical protein